MIKEQSEPLNLDEGETWCLAKSTRMMTTLWGILAWPSTIPGISLSLLNSDLFNDGWSSHLFRWQTGAPEVNFHFSCRIEVESGSKSWTSLVWDKSAVVSYRVVECRTATGTLLILNSPTFKWATTGLLTAPSKAPLNTYIWSLTTKH